MKKFLSKTLNNLQGFTLVELLVVITIIAILSVVGLTIFSGVQRNARDTKRRADIDAIAKALEVNKTPNSTLYVLLAGTQFGGGVIPVDNGVNGTATYCANITNAVAAPPAVPATWTNAAVNGCPTGYTTVSATYPTAATASWTVCALLETGTNPNNIYCRQSAQ